MAYYHILKQRRLDLNLSVQDIAIQTQLSPEFIRAIEENNLDLFSDDFSFVRYFVRAYADTIGVNWQAIAPEVDAHIAAYARARDMAMTQAQRRMIENIQQKNQKKQPKKKKRLKNPFRNSAGKISRSLNWNPKNRLSRTLILTVIAVLAVLGILSYAVDSLAARNSANARAVRQQELQAKEQETQRLADQLKSQKSAGTTETAVPEEQPVHVAGDSSVVNAFHVSNLKASDDVVIELHTAASTSISVYLNSELQTSDTVDGNWSWSCHPDRDSVLEVEIHSFTDGDTLKVDGTDVPLNPTGFNDGYGVVILYLEGLNSGSNSNQNAESSAADDGNDAGQSDAAADGQETDEGAGSDDSAGDNYDYIYENESAE